ncbi:unnamed protein product [Rotaria magnacalcarata]|uniref:Uncharacterized protein n=1 Tax=Rotaria magnacalcarata TaxID=392030 RepID=A0A817ASB6_9BILA|nr:unnamed protein product [Rotaria magnacalcarata]CAF2262562.1 unnamed protein product [Rotaria magnacalcarata]CAF3960497.1 unnamed protein product [Rotaria magnacalcarata]CAF4029381.1 unnamed protein product [Rotaria magnacalcarata]
MIINLKQKFMEILPETVPEGFLEFLESLDEDDYKIAVPTSDTQTATTQTSLIENDIINEIYQKLDEIYLKFIRINNLSESEKKSIETIINNLRSLIIKIINSLNGQISTYNNDIADLKKVVNSLQQKQIEIKRVNIISEILFPLKRNIFREMSNNNIPSYYYNVNVLKSLYSLNKDDITSANFYINVHKMSNEFDEQTFNLLQNLMHSFSTSQGTSYDILLILLIEKEKRNFQEHSIITDFIKDSYGTNDARLTSLLRQQDLLSEFKLTEIDVMDKIYTKYFSHLVNQS